MTVTVVVVFVVMVASVVVSGGVVVVMRMTVFVVADLVHRAVFLAVCCFG